MGKERVDVRVELDILEELEAIALRDGAGNRSAAVREAIYYYVEEKKDTWNTDKHVVKLPKRLTDRVFRLIRNKDATDFDDAIRAALRAWCKDREYDLKHGRHELDNLVAENMESDIANEEMARMAKKVSKR